MNKLKNMNQKIKKKLKILMIEKLYNLSNDVKEANLKLAKKYLFRVEILLMKKI